MQSAELKKAKRSLRREVLARRGEVLAVHVRIGEERFLLGASVADLQEQQDQTRLALAKGRRGRAA